MPNLLSFSVLVGLKPRRRKRCCFGLLVLYCAYLEVASNNESGVALGPFGGWESGEIGINQANEQILSNNHPPVS